MWTEEEDGNGQPRAPNPEYAEKRRVALAQIEEAFGALSRPRTQALREGLSQYAALERIVTELGQRSWRDIPVEPLRFHRDALPMMGPEALRFVLPAYLRASLTPSPARDDLLDRATIRALRAEDPAAWWGCSPAMKEWDAGG